MGETTTEPTPKADHATPMEITDDPTVCRVVIAEMVKALNAGARSRPRSLAVTKLEEAAMWLNEELKFS